MQNIISVLNSFQSYIILGLIVAVAILLIIILILAKSISKLENRYRKLMRGANNKNIEEMVVSYLDKIDEANEKTKYMKELFDDMNKRLKGCVQKTSIIRYKAFEDVGSDLSFSISLLDDNNDGVIITGIYGRNESTTYAKPIDKGISRYELSDEEKYVLETAIGKVIS